MENKLLKRSITLVSLLLLMSCQGPVRPIAVKANKQGGLYETLDSGKAFSFYNNTITYTLNTDTYIPLSDFERLQVEEGTFEGMSVLNFKLNDAGATSFKNMSERNLNKQICLVVDGRVVTAPTLQGAITNGMGSLQVDNKTMEAVVFYLEH
jgi:preprotein translocase subunit SecD